VRGGAGPSGAVPGTPGPVPPRTIGPVVRFTIGPVGSRSTSEGVGNPRFLGACQMIKDLSARTWRIAVTVGPLAAIALSLAAGLKWHW